jgi:hypothetical protein
MFVQRSSGIGSAWREMEAWRAKQKQYTAEAQALNEGVLSAVMDTFSSRNDGLIEITIRKALAAARQRAAERAKLNQASLGGVDLTV